MCTHLYVAVFFQHRKQPIKPQIWFYFKKWNQSHKAKQGKITNKPVTLSHLLRTFTARCFTVPILPYNCILFLRGMILSFRNCRSHPKSIFFLKGVFKWKRNLFSWFRVCKMLSWSYQAESCSLHSFPKFLHLQRDPFNAEKQCKSLAVYPCVLHYKKGPKKPFSLHFPEKPAFCQKVLNLLGWKLQPTENPLRILRQSQIEHFQTLNLFYYLKRFFFPCILPCPVSSSFS